MAEIASILANSGDSARLRRLASQGDSAANDQVLAQFEALFLQQMLKSMRAASSGSGLLRSEQIMFYWNMYDQHMAATLAEKQALGLSGIINKQLSADGAGLKPPGQALMASSDRLNHDRASAADDTGLPLRSLNIRQTASGKPVVVDINKAGTDKVGTDKTDADKTDSMVKRPQSFMPTSPQEFVSLAYQYAQRPAKKLAVNARVLVAIAALETGWGKHLPADKTGSSNNYFGIQADRRWPGAQVVSQTLEFRRGMFTLCRQSFRAYRTIKDSFNDFADFISTNDRYQKALTVAQDSKKFLQAMQQAGYATDPGYANKILKILDHKVFANINREYGNN